MNRPRSAAFTLVELLVVIAIIGILVALLLPAIQASRESARRAMCVNNLHQLTVALHDFEMAHEHYPAGTVDAQGPVKNLPVGHHISWIARILPYLEEVSLYNSLDLSVSAYHHKNDRARQTMIETLVCPSNPADNWPYSSYAGCHHDAEAPIDVNNQGVFFLNSRITRDDLKDGSAYTIFLGEKLIDDYDLGWLSGTASTLRNTGTALANKVVGSPWGANLNWLYTYPRDDSQWEFTDPQGPQVDPITGEMLEFDPETGEYVPVAEPFDAPAEGAPIDDAPPDETEEGAPAEDAAVDQASPVTEPAVDEPSTSEEPGPETPETEIADATEPGVDPAPEATDAEPFEPELGELGIENRELKPDANGFLPHSKLGGNPRAPLAVGGFSARHHGGVNFAFGDGSVRFIALEATAGLLGRLANRADGQIVDAKEW